MMHQKSLLLFYLLLLYSVNGTSSYTTSFTDIVSGSVKTNCAFELSYTDSYFTNTTVSCDRIWRWRMTVDYIHETKSMHILTLRLRISRSGRTSILSSSVEKSKLYSCFIILKNVNSVVIFIQILLEQCPIGYSLLCKSDQSNDEKTAICPATKV